jgi:hypothetical protein
VDAKNFSLHKCGNSKIVKYFSTVFPRIRISVFSNDLIVETINGCDLSGLVISSKKSNSCWVSDFISHQEFESFDRIISSINEITHENVGSFRNVPSLVEEF